MSRSLRLPVFLVFLVALAACGEGDLTAPVMDSQPQALSAADGTSSLAKKPDPGESTCEKILTKPGLKLIAEAGGDQTVGVLPGETAAIQLDGTGSSYGGCSLNGDFKFLWVVSKEVNGKRETVARAEGPQVTVELSQGIYIAVLSVIATHFDKVGAKGLARITVVKKKPEPPAKDNTPPLVQATVTGTLGNAGWYVSDVTVSWLVIDKESAVNHSCGPTVIDSDGAGQVVTCSATSAGGTTTESVTIDRDATPPAVAWTGAKPGYDIDERVAISCAVSDATSGVASTDCQDVDRPAYLFAAGTNTLSASAEDVAGNQGSGTLSFDVQATVDGLANIVDDLVSDQGTARSLAAKLRAGNGNGKGQAQATANRVGAFINHVEAQRGKKISTEAADILVRWAETLR